MTGPSGVTIADRLVLIREALQEILSGVGQVELVATFADGDELLAAVETNAPDVIITDIRMPPGGDDEGIRIARQVRSTHPTLGVIVLSQFADAGYALSLLEDGAAGRGYVLKDRLHDRADLIAAIEVVARGGTTIDPGLVHELLAADRPRQRSH